MPKPQSLNHAFTDRALYSARDHLSPSKRVFDKHGSTDLLDAMADTYLCGIRNAVLDEQPEPDDLLMEDFPHVYKPLPGRCLWNMADIKRLDPGYPLRALYSLCQVPSDRQPHLEGITPYHAMLMAGYKASQVIALSPWPIKPGYMSQFLSMRDFGKHNAEVFKASRLEYKVPKNSKRTAAQHHAIQLDAGAHYTLPKCILDYPPVRFELLPKIDEAWAKVLPNVKALAPRKKTSAIAATLEMAALPNPPEQVIEMYLGLSGYRDGIPYERIYRTDIDDREHALLVCTRQLTQLLYCEGGHRATSALAISLVSGVSPAVFAHSSIDRLMKTGVSFLSDGDMLKMAGLLQELPEPLIATQQQARRDLLDELDQLAGEYSAVWDRFSLSRQEELYTLTQKPKDMPAWGVFSDTSGDDD